MAKTKALALSTTPLNIITDTDTPLVIVKEDESVANWPTTALIIKKPSTGDPNTITAGKSVQFVAPPGCRFASGTTLGQVYLPAGTTSGIQDEQ